MTSDQSWRPTHDDEDDDEELDETQYKSQKDAVLFAIQVSPSMLTKPELDDSVPTKKGKKPDTDCPTSAALKCAYELMQQRIISNPHDMIGILLFGTAETKSLGEQGAGGAGGGGGRGGMSHANCYQLVDLCVPAAEDVKAVRSLVEDEAEFERIVRPAADSEQVSMANVLFCANQIFTTRAPNFVSRRLFLITDDDDPHHGSKALRSAAAVRARDLYDLGVSIDLFPISRPPDYSFDRAKFYNDIIYSQTPTDPEATQSLIREAKTARAGDSGIPLLQSLLSSIKSRSVPKRAQFSIPLELGPNLRISIKGYIIFKRQEAARKSYVWVKGEQAQLVQSHSGMLRSDRGDEVTTAAAGAGDKGSSSSGGSSSNIRKAFKFGGAQISFTPEELGKLRSFGDPVIRIIGFKPRAMLPLWANIKNSTLIYPTEEGYVGSTRVFSALWQKMLADDKMALAWFVPRKNATPTIAALLPGAEKVSSSSNTDDNQQQQQQEPGTTPTTHTEQVLPPGIWVIPLPFADDVRRNPEFPQIAAPDAVVDSMRQIVQLLQLPRAIYAPDRYPNPSLQWHYRILQALALDEDVPEGGPDDRTVPKYRQMDKRAGAYVREWGAELEAAHLAWQAENRGKAKEMDAAATLAATTGGGGGGGGAVAGSKRPRERNVKEVLTERSRRVKTEDGEGAVSDADGEHVMTDEMVRSLFEKNRLDKLKVAQLKTWLEGKGLKGAGKKADLVDRAEQFFEHK